MPINPNLMIDPNESAIIYLPLKRLITSARPTTPAPTTAQFGNPETKSEPVTDEGSTNAEPLEPPLLWETPEPT